MPPDYARQHGAAGEHVVLVGEILAGGAAWGSHAKVLGDSRRITTITPLVTAYAAQGLHPPEPWSIAAEAESLRGYLDSMSIATFHLGGWSLGGAIALHLAMTYPGRVRSLALVEPVAWWVIRQLGLTVDGYDEFLDAHRQFTVGEIEEAAVARFLHTVGAVRPDVDPRTQRGWQLAVANRMAIPYSWRVIHNEDDVARLQGLRMPVLLVHGDASRPFDVAITDALAGLVPQAETLVLPGGHTSHIVNLGAFIERYDAFLARAEQSES